MSSVRLAICGLLIALGGLGSAALIAVRTNVPEDDLFVRIEFRAAGLVSLKADDVLRQLLRRETTANLAAQLPGSMRDEALAFSLRRDLQIAADRAYQDDQVFALMLGFEAPLPFDASTSATILNHLAMEGVLALDGSAGPSTKGAVTLMRFDPAIVPVVPFLSWSHFAAIIAAALSVSVGALIVALTRPRHLASTSVASANTTSSPPAALVSSEPQIPIVGRVRRQS